MLMENLHIWKYDYRIKLMKKLQNWKKIALLKFPFMSKCQYLEDKSSPYERYLIRDYKHVKIFLLFIYPFG